jgi:hypothetical protein
MMRERTYSMVQTKKLMKGWQKLQHRQKAARIAALAEQGLPPRPRDNTFIWGCPSFSISLRKIDSETVGITLGHATAGRPRGETFIYVWGAAWPDYDQSVEARPLLRGLIAAWPVIARPFLKGRAVFTPGPRVEADLAAMTGDATLPALCVVADGPGLQFEHANGAYDPESESLIVVECLLAMGDKLAELLGGAPEAADWAEVRALADVFPWSFRDDGDTDDEQGAIEDRFYAAKFGLDPVAWERHMLAHMTARYLEGTPHAFPDLRASLPDENVLKEQLLRTLERVGENRDEFLRMIRAEFRMECRAEIYYAKWPSRH